MSDYKTLESAIRNIQLQEAQLDADKLREKADIAKRDGTLIARPSTKKDPDDHDQLTRRQAAEHIMKKIHNETYEMFNVSDSLVKEAAKIIKKENETILKDADKPNIGKKGKNPHILMAGEKKTVTEAKSDKLDLKKLSTMSPKQRKEAIRLAREKVQQKAQEKLAPKPKKTLASTIKPDSSEEKNGHDLVLQMKATGRYKEKVRSLKSPDERERFASKVAAAKSRLEVHKLLN